MLYQALAIALQIALVGPDPMRLATGTDCPTFNNRINESVVLSRLCSEAAFNDGDAEGADAACSVALRQLADLGPDLRAATGLPVSERQRCLPDADLRRGLRALDFTIAFMQFRQDGSVPMPAPFIPSDMPNGVSPR